MNFKVVRTLDQFCEIKQEWNNLLSKIDEAQIFYKWEWVREYIEYLDKEYENSLAIILIYDKNILIGVLPFLCENHILRFITNKTVDYNNVYIHKSCNKYTVLEKAMEFVFAELQFNSIILNNFSGSSELYIINDIVKNKYNCYTFLEDSVITPKLFLTDGKELKYRMKQLKDIDRRKRKLEKEANVKVSISCGYNEDIWEFLCTNHKKRWVNSVLKDEKYIHFYQKIIQELRDNIEISKLEVDGEIVATHFGFKDEKKVYYYIPIYDEKYSSHGVGYILLKEIIDYYDGKCEFDFLRGNESYKFNWCDKIDMNYNMYAFKPSATNKIKSILYYIKIYIKKSKFLRKIFKK